MTDTSNAIATAETLLMVARTSEAKHNHCILMEEGGDAILSLSAEVERLQAALATARDDALEQSATYVEKCDDGSLSYQVAAAIRAMKGKPHD